MFKYKDPINLHELMKEALHDREDTSISYNNESINNTNIEYMQQYILLDSFNKIKTSKTELGEYNWALNPQGQVTPESIGIYGTLDYVVEIQVGSFTLPILEEVPYLTPSIVSIGDVDLVQNNSNSEINLPPLLTRKNTNFVNQYPLKLFTSLTQTYVYPWINNPYTQTPCNNRITIQLKEAGLQSFSNTNNSKFNFEFELYYDPDLSINPNFIHAKPINLNGWDYYKFLIPLRNLNTISLIFKNPDNPIIFEPDVMYHSVINLTFDPMSGGSHITIFTQYPHKLLAGDRIFLQNFSPQINNVFNTNFPTYLINYINRSEGHVVNVVFGTSPSLSTGSPIPGVSFSLDPSIKFINPIKPSISASFPGLVDVFIVKRRLRIPIKIKYIKNKHNKNDIM